MSGMTNFTMPEQVERMALANIRKEHDGIKESRYVHSQESAVEFLLGVIDAAHDKLKIVGDVRDRIRTRAYRVGLSSGSQIAIEEVAGILDTALAHEEGTPARTQHLAKSC